MGDWKVSFRSVPQKPTASDLQNRGIVGGGADGDSTAQLQRKRIPGDVYREGFGMHPGA